MQDVEVAAPRPDVAREVEPKSKLAMLAHAARLDASHGETFDFGVLTQTGPAVGNELNEMAAPPQLARERQRLQRRAAVLRVEVGGVHQDAGQLVRGPWAAFHGPIDVNMGLRALPSRHLARPIARP